MLWNYKSFFQKIWNTLPMVKALWYTIIKFIMLISCSFRNRFFSEHVTLFLLHLTKRGVFIYILYINDMIFTIGLFQLFAIKWGIQRFSSPYSVLNYNNYLQISSFKWHYNLCSIIQCQNRWMYIFSEQKAFLKYKKKC